MDFQQTFVLPWNLSIFMSDLPILKFKRTPVSIHAFLKLVYFYRWLAHFEIQNKLAYFYRWPALSNFKKKLACFAKIDLFSRATCPFWNSKFGLFSRVNYLFYILKKNFSKYPCFFEIDLFSISSLDCWGL